MVNTNKLKLTILQKKILRLLFKKTGTKLNQRRIAKTLKVSPPAVKKALPDLKNYIITNQDKESKRWEIELNRENHHLMQLKRADNLSQIYESGLFEFLEEEYAGATIILFGSYSKGEDTINSDIDIAVIERKPKSLDLKKYEILLERDININHYNSFKDIHKNLKENLCNGIILAGAIEL